MLTFCTLYLSFLLIHVSGSSDSGNSDEIQTKKDDDMKRVHQVAKTVLPRMFDDRQKSEPITSQGMPKYDGDRRGRPKIQVRNDHSAAINPRNDVRGQTKNDKQAPTPRGPKIRPNPLHLWVTVMLLGLIMGLIILILVVVVRLC
ncbi:hypothetical protein RF11_03146 [Thelohanellus kitauei]|uniref:Uncharacterized protein n=1 Tax=Thelohanellus kitauei TaxID=669202 RepID=A0A0C2JB33_THEKT|nr:hypothetical protein RF11_03146 [Thelohanellus kitauei]